MQSMCDQHSGLGSYSGPGNGPNGTNERNEALLQTVSRGAYARMLGVGFMLRRYL
jgi:hypothetical protein